MSNPLDIGVCLKAGFETFKNNWMAFAVGLLLYEICVGVTAGLLAGPLLVAYCGMALRASRGETVAIGDLFGEFGRFVPCFLLALVWSLCVIVGYMCLLIPGFIAIWFGFWAFFIMADGEDDFMAALKKAFATSKENAVPVIIFMIVVGFVSYIGILCFGLGIFVTAPTAILAMAHGYDRLYNGAGAAA